MKDLRMENGLKWKGRPETKRKPRPVFYWKKNRAPKTRDLIVSGAVSKYEFTTLGQMYFGKALKVRIGAGGFNYRRELRVKNK